MRIAAKSAGLAWLTHEVSGQVGKLDVIHYLVKPTSLSQSYPNIHSNGSLTT